VENPFGEATSKISCDLRSIDSTNLMCWRWQTGVRILTVLNSSWQSSPVLGWTTNTPYLGEW
jgi:hypothetical protein